jgi:Phage late-transcription coactivator
MPTKNEIAEFSDMISSEAEAHSITIMDAVVTHCQLTGMEVDIASTLLSSALKAKIREEAETLNLLKKTSTLPI